MIIVRKSPSVAFSTLEKSITVTIFSNIFTHARASGGRSDRSCSSIQDTSADPRSRDVVACLLHVMLARSCVEMINGS